MFRKGSRRRHDKGPAAEALRPTVKMLQQPNHPQTTAAVPKLIAETLEAQSADIDTVSGATITSEAYKKSLQATIDDNAKTASASPSASSEAASRTVDG